MLAGLVFVLFGALKFPFAQLELAEFVRYGFPDSLLIVWLVGTVEVVAGVALAPGLGTRPAAAALAVVMAGAVLTAGVRVGGPFHLGLAPTLLVISSTWSGRAPAPPPWITGWPPAPPPGDRSPAGPGGSPRSVPSSSTRCGPLTAGRRLLPVVALSVLTALLLQVLLEFGPLSLVALAVPAVLYGPYWAVLTSTLGHGGALAGRVRLDRRGRRPRLPRCSWPPGRCRPCRWAPGWRWLRKWCWPCRSWWPASTSPGCCTTASRPPCAPASGPGGHPVLAAPSSRSTSLFGSAPRTG